MKYKPAAYRTCSQPFGTLANRAGFVKVQGSEAKVVAKGFIALMVPRDDEAFVIGYTASKKMGNAIKRARIKRRLRAAVDQVVRLNPAYASTGMAVVLIARHAVVDMSFERLVTDLAHALKQWQGATS